MNISVESFESYMQNKNLKARTIENYLYYFGKFTYIAFNQDTVSKFLAIKSNRNSIARGFLSNLQKFLKTNYKELGYSKEQREDIIEVDFPKMTGRKKERLINPLTHEEIKKLEGYLDSEILKLQLLISYYSGLRLGEMLKIRILDFNWSEWKKDKTNMGECRVFGKGDKEGIAILPPFLMKRVQKFILIKNYKGAGSRLFVSDNVNINMKSRERNWQNKLFAAGVNSGITKFDRDIPVEGTRVHPHRLRHSYGYYLRNVKGMDTREIQELLRHSSIQSTQIYTKTDKEKLKASLKGAFK